ncbi:MAG: hypothetical protein Q8K82_05030 [Gemmatimonadaceae bacterium]|nr:hypothetical protein [Gemmatimonadaceae bacterium]
MSFARVASASTLALVLAACSASDGAVAPLASSNTDNQVGTAVASLRLRCELRRSSGARSTISVDGNNLLPLDGMWAARVTSGANSAAAPLTRGVGDEVEFDFSSQPNDIAAGAIPIARNFITVNTGGPDVTASIRDASGTVVASGSADCRVR